MFHNHKNTKVEYTCMMTTVIPACKSRPCANDGKCTSMGAFDFTCQCAVGYTGSTCDMDIDDCVSVTCPTNSMCMDGGVNKFECKCLPGFEEVNGSCVMALQTESPNTGPSTGEQILHTKIRRSNAISAWIPLSDFHFLITDTSSI